MIRTLGQLRAEDALNQVRKIEKECSPEVQEKFATYTEGLPAAILNNGLGQACAALLARAEGKKDDAHYLLFEALEKWLCRDDPHAPYRKSENLMDAIVGGSRSDYILAQEEALAWLEWLKKFAVAFFKKHEKKES
ncbi:MAG: type III-B CRISPR module-associated protein Cmr5 [Clostridia bacterium]|nr:type III-B CRISPR module-associated protein Cmr5 [Clostridia bacterium]